MSLEQSTTLEQSLNLRVSPASITKAKLEHIPRTLHLRAVQHSDYLRAALHVFVDDLYLLTLGR